MCLNLSEYADSLTNYDEAWANPLLEVHISEKINADRKDVHESSIDKKCVVWLKVKNSEGFDLKEFQRIYIWLWKSCWAIELLTLLLCHLAVDSASGG